MLISSTWKVQLAGVVLLDVTDATPAEPKIDRVFATDRVLAIGAASVRNVGRQNIAHTVSFSRVSVFNDDTAARTFMRTHTEALPVVEEYLELQWLNQFAGDTFQSCVVSGYNARCEGNWFLADYTLSTGAIVPNFNILALGLGFINVPGTTTPYLGVLVYFPSGVGSVTQDVVLQTGAVIGDLRDVFLETPTAGPTVRVRNLTNAGTILWTRTNGPAYARFSWDGTNWSRIL
jgi:hypothetical protein